MSAPRKRRARELAESLLREQGVVGEGLTAGSCMWPFLPPGVRAVPVESLPDVGSVAVYKSGLRLSAHRVVGVFDGGFYARSDRPGAPIERVDAERLVGVWERGAGWRNVFLRPRVGRLIASMGIALSEPGALRILRALWRRLPAPIWPRPEVSVFLGSPEELSLELTNAGITPREATLEGIESCYLRPKGGFAVICPSIGGALVRFAYPEDEEFSLGDVARRGIMRWSVRRRHRRTEVLDEILQVTLDEASHRGFGAIEVEAALTGGIRAGKGSAENESLMAEALRRHGFACIDVEHRRVPGTGGRIALYRAEISTARERRS